MNKSFGFSKNFLNSAKALINKQKPKCVHIASLKLANFSRNITISSTKVYKNNNENNKSFFVIQNNQQTNQNESNANLIAYQSAANETLESLTEKFDSIGEQIDDESISDEFDVSYSNGVLTVKLGVKLGTYVLNKQTPNLQIWLSSPMSGPKRFDFIQNKWIYKRTGETLHDLLSKELTISLNKQFDFADCSFASKTA